MQMPRENGGMILHHFWLYERKGYHEFNHCIWCPCNGSREYYDKNRAHHLCVDIEADNYINALLLCSILNDAEYVGKVDHENFKFL